MALVTANNENFYELIEKEGTVMVWKRSLA